MNDFNNTVIIDVESYEKLVRDSAKLEAVKTLLLNSIKIYYRGDDFRVDEDEVIAAISLIDDEAVNQRKRFLQEEYNRKHKEEGSDE